MLSINTNLSSLITQRNLKESTNLLNQAIERMTTGFKINHAKDNAANYSIATNMTTKIGAYQVAEQNASMGLDMVKTGSETIAQMENHATRLRSLIIQARNGTYGGQSLNAIQAEANAITSEIDRLYNTAEYNGISLFTGGTKNASATTEVTMFTMARSSTLTNYDFDNITAVSDCGGSFNESLYKIEDIEDLKEFARLTNLGKDTTGKTFVLVNDIDIGTYCDEEIAKGNGGWTPIGSSAKAFKGTFDGNGHVIINLKVNRDDSYQGLFGCTDTGSIIKNIGLDNVNIIGESYVGGLVGESYSSIYNSYTTGRVESVEYVGGLIGGSYAPITNCYSTSKVIGDDYVGGLIGESYDNVISCYATGNITGYNAFIGGLIGIAQGSITNCYAIGNAIGYNYVAGLVGSSNASIMNCYATGSACGTTNSAGLVGKIYGSINNSATVQYDAQATQMTKEEIKATYTPESMGFTEANGWTIVDGTPLLSWQKNSTPGTSSGGAGGSYGVGSISLQVGTTSSSSCQIGFDMNFSYDLSVLGIDVSSDEALDAIDDFIEELSLQSTKLGAVQNRLESVLDEIGIQYENLVSSHSTIRDADIAKVSSQYIQQQILQQASATLMATANQSPSIALQLI